MYIQIRKVFVVILPVLIYFNLYSQKTLIYTNPDVLYKNGVELFDNEQYGAAQFQFDEAVKLYGELNFDMKTNAEFYSALCAIELYNGDAEYLITKFIDKYPESPKARKAEFEMGKFRYRQQNYEEAIFWFEKVDKTWLTDEDRAEYFFKSGYCYFSLNKYDKASEAFYEIKDINTKYTSPAIYYYSHIAYINKNYETALNGFKKLTEDETFKSVIPYYITQILFFQRKYSELTNYAPKFLESVSTKRTPEIARIIGESYIMQNQFDKALKYLKIYDEKARNKTREDKYLLAVTNYKLGNYTEAVALFEVITGEPDSLSQNSYYFLADCYLRSKEKEKASLAFSAASKMNYNEVIKEDALYNYAKLTFELKLTPFNNAVEAFNEYIQTYPESKHIDEAYDYLTIAFMNTRNYSSALETLDKIKDKDTRIKEAYQRIAFFRGLELFNNLNYEEAIEAFQKSLTFFWYNRSIRAQSIYWIGEAYYRLNVYDLAIKNYNDFLLSPGAISLPEYSTAHYNIGYSYFKQEKYDSSLTWFRKYVNTKPQNADNLLADAFNRIGDCYYTVREFWPAIEQYENAIALNTFDIDYSLYQKGFLLGLADRPAKKITTLSTLISQYPNSTYYDDALFETAKSYMSQRDFKNAETYYQKITQDFSSSKYMLPSLLQLGLIKYNLNENIEAIKYYKRVIEEFDNTPEANDALTGLKNIYVDENDVESYFSYVESLGKGATITSASQDSLLYAGAENKYMQGDCNNSLDKFKIYIEKFPYGFFVINAHFYMAECYLKNNEWEKSLEAYNFVINKPNNEFTDQALLNSAKIHFNQGNYMNAYDYFSKVEVLVTLKNKLLDSRVGMMRSAKELKDDQRLIVSCDKIIHTELVPEELLREARYNKAIALYRKKDYSNALPELRLLSEDITSKEGSEAKYLTAYVLSLQKTNDKAKTEIMDFITKGSPHQYWMAKCFLLLSDIYLAENDIFQAKATLQSLIDNYTTTDDNILDEANEKLLAIIKNEKQKEFTKKEDVIELDFKENADGRYNNLFMETDSITISQPIK